MPIRTPPRPGFRAAGGRIHGVTVRPTWFGIPGTTEAQKAGLRYEQKVQNELKLKHHEGFLVAPRLDFYEGHLHRSCVPDGILELEDRRVVIEIKAQHMPEAWWQLRRLYQPVLEAYLPLRPVQVLEVCRVYDAGMPFPEEVNIIYDLEAWIRGPVDSRFGVFVWKL